MADTKEMKTLNGYEIVDAKAREEIKSIKENGGGGSVEGAVLYTEQTLTDEQKAQARENIGAVGVTSDITTKGEVGEFIASGGKIIHNNAARGCFFNVKENTLYKITVKGEHNRFYVSGCMVESILTNSDAITIFQSQRNTVTTETETCTVNSEGYKSLLVTVCYNLASTDVSVEYAETKDGVVGLDGTEMYTAGKVDQLIAPLTTGSLVYTTERNVYNVATTAKIYELYDALVTKYPTYITKNVIGQNSEGTSVCEYVFTSGNYNEASTMRNKDDTKVKPTVLVISGVHGYERSAVMATYQFFRDLANYLPILYPLREGLTFKVIPVVTPYAFDNNTRVNENGVNINRNFNCNWTSTANDGINYSGEAAADQAETQIVQAWLEANTSATLFVDHHNSGYDNEVSMLSGLNTADRVTEIKGLYLQGLTKVIPYWKNKKGFADTLVFAYTGFIGGHAMSTDYAQDKEITSVCLETSWDQNSLGLHSAESIAVGAEVLGNMLLAMYDKIARL